MNIDVIATIILILIIIYFFVTERKRRNKRKKYKFLGLQDGWRDQLPKYDSYSETGAHEGTVRVTDYRGPPHSSHSSQSPTSNSSSPYSPYDYKPLFQKPKRKKKINKHEERCRVIFQNIFHVPFSSIRPEWLKNPVTGRNLELDGFNPDIVTPVGKGLAFEYDGHQHSAYKPHFHRGGVDDFKYQVKKDTFKDLKCKERGVLLVRIPHFVDYYDLDRFIAEKLQKMGVGQSGGSSGYASKYRPGMYA